jgi:hypothetical protein
MNVVVVIICIIILCSPQSECSVIAGKITTCVDTNTLDNQLSCVEKLSVTLTLGKGDNTELSYTIDSATRDGATLPLSREVKVIITQQNYTIIYPLLYAKTFNAKPVERIIYRKDLLISQCSDSPSAANPTCGWMRDENGRKIDYSQGFCCSCKLAELLGQSNSGSRGSLNCQKFVEKYSSAHCIQLDDDNYDAFEIQTPVLSFSITVDVEGQDFKERFILSPYIKMYVSQNHYVAAELVGNFATFEQIPQFSNVMLFVPVSGSIAKEGPKFWMLIDKSRVTLDGTECDKIGSLHYAFRNQANACERHPMDCLQNQLKDYHLQDVEREKVGQTPFYHLARYGDFRLGKGKTNQVALLMTPTEASVSMVNLVIDASKITTIIRVSPGKIVAIVIDSASIQKIQRMMVDATNTGTHEATYRISVLCSDRVLDTLVEQRASIAVKSKATFSYDIHLSSTDAGTANCTGMDIHFS